MPVLFHYSDKLFHHIKSLRAQGHLTPVQIREAEKLSKGTILPPYIDNISFFIDPLHLSAMPGYYDDKHTFYKHGKELFEYEIDTADLGELTYQLVESPEKTAMVYDPSIDDAEFYAKMDEYHKSLKYIGNNVNDLDEVINRFKGTIDSYFHKVKNYPDFEKLMSKYAALVPHLMIYPKSGVVKYRQIHSIVMGDDHRWKVTKKPSLESSIVNDNMSFQYTKVLPNDYMIRLASLNDVKGITELRNNNANPNTGFDKTTEEVEKLRLENFSLNALSIGNYFVLTHKNTIVGLMLLTLLKKDEVNISTLLVDKGHQGKGLGTELI